MLSLSAQSPRCVPQSCHGVSLKQHQLAMLHRCLEIDRDPSKRLGVMSDLPGAGKTYVALALIMERMESCSIVVVPMNIYSQWTHAIETFCGNRVRWTCMASYADVSRLMHDKSILSNYDIVITMPLYYGLLADCLDQKTVGRVIIDEVDSINFFIRCKKVHCDMLWLVSASFRQEVADALQLAFTPDENEVKCEPEFVKDSFLELHSCPEEVTIVCNNVYLDTIMRGLVEEDAFRAMNAMDFGDNPAVMTEKDALDLFLRDLNTTIEAKDEAIKKLHQGHADTLFLIEKMKTAIENESIVKNIEKEEEELMKAIKDVAAIESRVSKESKALADLSERRGILLERLKENDMCYICYEEMQDKAIMACCKNAFCWSCLSQYWTACGHRGRKCPYCRQDVTCRYNVVRVIPDPVPDLVEDESTEDDKKSKLENITELFREDKVGAKVIIFSDFPKIFDRVKETLHDDLGVSCIELNGGNVNDLQRDIAKFKQGDARVLMSNSGLYGCGMNLEMTTDIIFVHKVLDHMHDQVIGRAQRPGRTCRLRVWQLLHKNELE